jgi:hypothetical protein
LRYGHQMTVAGPAGQEEWICSFLRAEMGSPRFRREVIDALTMSRIKPEELFLPANADVRRKILWSYRGGYLAGFPNDVLWQRVQLDREDLRVLHYSSYPTWVSLSGQSRRAVDGALNIDRFVVQENDGKSLNGDVKDIAKDIVAGQTIETPIAVGQDYIRLVLVEGHKRATAHVYSQVSGPLEILCGLSLRMHEWCRF